MDKGVEDRAICTAQAVSDGLEESEHGAGLDLSQHKLSGVSSFLTARGLWVQQGRRLLVICSTNNYPSSEISYQ